MIILSKGISWLFADHLGWQDPTISNRVAAGLKLNLTQFRN